MKCLICNKECVDIEFLRRHASRQHRVATQEYVLRFELNDIVPKCKCGCGENVTWHQPTKRYNDYIHGHHAQFRIKTAEEKTKISRANSKNMKRYMRDNPDVAYRRSKDLQKGLTAETRVRAIQNMKLFWKSDSDRAKASRKAASERAIVLLEQGKIGPQAPYKAQWMTNPFTGQDEYMHSSWETSFLERCIKVQFPVTKKHDIRIPYVDVNGIDRTYVPDFVGLEANVIFEIKGFVDENVSLKRAALDNWAEANEFETVFIQCVDELAA